MPIKHAAVKQLRKDRRRQPRNQAIRSELKTLTKQFLALLQEQRLEDAGRLLRVVAKKFDRAASRHIIHPNTAARYKSAMMRRIHRRAAAPEPNPSTG